MTGTVVVNEQIFQIDSIRLLEGTLKITATKRDVMDPVTVHHDDVTSVFGEDGMLIGSGHLRLSQGSVTAQGDPEIGPATLTLILPLGIKDSEFE